MGLFGSGSNNSPVIKWEPLKNEGSSWEIKWTYRTKVPGGWLISAGGDTGNGVTFLPDPKHEWDGNSL